MVRNMRPEQALETLSFTNKAAALPLLKAIKTAVANASTNAPLEFKSLEINEGLKLKRFRYGTAGRHTGRSYKKRWSHIKVVLTDDLNMKTQNSKVKNTSQKSKVKDVMAQDKLGKPAKDEALEVVEGKEIK